MADKPQHFLVPVGIISHRYPLRSPNTRLCCSLHTLSTFQPWGFALWNFLPADIFIFGSLNSFPTQSDVSLEAFPAQLVWSHSLSPSHRFSPSLSAALPHVHLRNYVSEWIYTHGLWQHGSYPRISVGQTSVGAMKCDHITCHPAGTPLGMKDALLIITPGPEA